jgi:predicted permease
MFRQTPRVPRIFEALLAVTLPPEEQGAALGDLAEEFQRIEREEGRAVARRWYRRQVLSSLRSSLQRRAWRRHRGFTGGSRPFEPSRPTSMNGVGHDLRHALRSLLRQPMYLVVAVLTLGVGIGGTASLWSVIHDTLLRPLPYADDEELVGLWDPFSWRAPELLLMRDHWPQSFESAAGYTTISVTFRLPEGPTSQYNTTRSESALLEVLGTPPLLGRWFEPGDDAVGAAPVVVLGHDVWRDDMGGDPSALGRTVVVDGLERTVVGVMPRGFFFPDPSYSLYVPGPIAPDNNSGMYAVIARLPPDRTIDEMGPALDRATGVLGENFTYSNPEWDRSRGAELIPLRTEMVGDVRRALWLTLVAVGLILAMAVANVAALALSRTRARRQELAIRTALGAGRVRIGRQLLVEAGVVGSLAGVVGVIFASAAFEAIVRSLPLTRELSLGLAVDWRVFAVAFVLSIAAALAVGSAPVVSILRRAPRSGLGSVSRSVTSRGGLERVLVVMEMAMAVVLITGAGLMLRSVGALYEVDPGFDPDGLLKVTVTMGERDFESAQRARTLEELAERLESIPGVESAAAVQVPPLWGSGWNFGLTIEGREPTNRSTLYRIVTPGYFATAGVDVLRGRDFERTDAADAEVVTIVNEAFAREYFADEEVLGARVDAGLGSGFARIVGVVEDEAIAGLREPVGPARYVMGRQFEYATENNTFLVRTSMDPVISLAEAVRYAVREADPRIAVSDLETMNAAYQRALGRTGQLVWLLSALGVLGAIIGAVGVYGVVNQFVARRTREWGVRLALGQSPRRVVGQVMSRAAGLVALGVLFGTGAAWLGAGTVSALLYGVAPRDVASFAVSAGALALVGLVAAAIPAHRAARVDPVVSLQAEG